MKYIVFIFLTIVLAGCDRSQRVEVYTDFLKACNNGSTLTTEVTLNQWGDSISARCTTVILREK